MLEDQELVSRASTGDRAAFDTLAQHNMPALRSVVRRMIGHPEDTQDVVQDALLKAWQGLPSFRGQSRFGTWLLAIGARAAVDHLRSRKRWRERAQIAHANACQQSEQMGLEVFAAVSSPDFVFEAREHIAYCFACVGRSLPPEQQGAIVMREVLDVPNREAAVALQISEPVFRHRLSDARRTMEACFEGLCSLVNKNGICYQCKGLRDTTPEARRGGPIPTITSFEDRLAYVREADVDAGSSQALHDASWRHLKAIEEEGKIPDMPETDCGR